MQLLFGKPPIIRRHDTNILSRLGICVAFGLFFNSLQHKKGVPILSGLVNGLAQGVTEGYYYAHIRPLVVRLLNHPEQVPNPWGFFISTPKYLHIGGCYA